MSGSVDRYPYRPKSEKMRFYGHRTRAFRHMVFTAIAETTGPMVEAHGPSKNGYAAFGTGRLPKPIVITSPDESKPHTHKQASVHDWPFENGSLGVLVNSRMLPTPRDVPLEPEIADAHFRDTNSDNIGSWQLARVTQRQVDARRLTDRDKAFRDAAWQDPVVMRRASTFQLLAVARRSLEEGGILLRRDFTAPEMHAALELGFEYLDGSFLEPFDDLMHGRFSMPQEGEVAFRLTNMDTPLGQIVMQQNVE